MNEQTIGVVVTLLVVAAIIAYVVRRRKKRTSGGTGVGGDPGALNPTHPYEPPTTEDRVER